MTMIKSFCGDSDPDWDQEPFCAATHPPCEHQDTMHCEPCYELTEIEARIENLHSQLKNLHEQHRQARTRRNHVHSTVNRRLPLEILTYIFTLTFPSREEPPCCASLATEQTTIPLVIAAVCHPWRVVALSTPKLWCNLDVNANKPNFPLLTHQIAYSGVIPLSIFLFSDVPVLAHHLPGAKQAMSFVLKQLHRTSSFYFDIDEGSILDGVFCDLPDIDYPKAAPLLEEIHAHWCTNDEQLRLAIEPPCPRRVVLASEDILLAWNNVSSVSLTDFSLPLPFLRSSMDLRHLELGECYIASPADQPLVINQSIEELALRSSTSACFMFTATSLPSLRALEIHSYSDHKMYTLCRAFLHRSLCPLKTLTLNLMDCTTSHITDLTAILENTNLLQHLSFQLASFSELPGPSIEPLLHRITSSRENSFLPCLQSLAIDIGSPPPIRLLLDLMLDRPPCEEINGFDPIRRPLSTLKLDFHIRNPPFCPISQDDLLRISQLREAGRTITITFVFICADGTVEVVEY